VLLVGEWLVAWQGEDVWLDEIGKLSEISRWRRREKLRDVTLLVPPRRSSNSIHHSRLYSLYRPENADRSVKPDQTGSDGPNDHTCCTFETRIDIEECQIGGIFT
jgi:hypothetical protein